MYKLLLLAILAITINANPISSKVLNLVKQNEGYSKHLYYDVSGYSIGYGTNLANGLSKGEAELLLKYRLNVVYKQLNKYEWFLAQSPNRKIALIDLTYNLGLPKLLHFKVFLWRLKNGYFHGAANALKDSIWYRQVGKRAKKIYSLIYKG